jgi:hypothetical protein
MPPTRRIAVVTLVAVSAALVLAGCTDSTTTASAPARPAPTAATRAAPTPAAPTTAASVLTAGQAPRQYAQTQAPELLQAFAPPPGTRRVTASPSADLDFVEGSTTDLDKNVVDKFTEWVAPGKPANVLAQAARHVPARYRLLGSGTSGATAKGAPVLDDVFQLPPVPGVLNLRELDITVVPVADDAKGQPRTGIRVDALVGWVTGQPARQWIPDGARVMTLTEVPSTLRHTAGRPPAPATITNAAQVQDIVSVINALSPIPKGAVYSCPADFGGEVTLTFRARVAGPVLATATLPLSGCAFVGVLRGGKPVAGLVPADSATDVLGRIARLTGQNWAA